MDYKERMEQMRREMERRRMEMEERLKSQRDRLNATIGQTSPLPESKPVSDVNVQSSRQNESLPQSQPEPKPITQSGHEDEKKYSITMLTPLPGLKDATKTKIGNFARLAPAYLSQINEPDQQFARFGYSTIDLSGLINLLAAVVEIEFNDLLKDHLEEWGLLEPNRKDATLGSLSFVYHDDNTHGKAREFMETVLSSTGERINIHRSAKQFDEIRNKRNAANHVKILSLKEFVKFYNNTYYPFFHETIRSIAAYKVKNEKQGNKKSNPDNFGFQQFASTGGRFSTKDYENQLKSLFDDEGPGANPPQICVVFTDLDQLSLKYFNEIIQKNQQGDILFDGPDYIFENFLKPYFINGANAGIQYLILNAADPVYSRLIDEHKSWQSYLNILDSFCENNTYGRGIPYNINSENPINLFILGGDDVIPMPKVKNPIYSPVVLQEKTEVLETILEADWVYSFPGKNIELNKDGYLQYEPLAGKKPRFFVSRLPMENGLMESVIGQDLINDDTTGRLGYFARVAQSRNGIDINNISVVACDSAKKVANLIVEGLPVNPPVESISEDCAFANAYVSPNLSIDPAKMPDPVSTKKYLEALKETDMLVFALHSNGYPNTPYYIGESARKDLHVPVFSPEILYDCPAKVMVPICCWGARFINYRRDKSMLLTSIYTSGLIFFGSCRTAMGPFDPSIENGYGIALAEKLQRLFLQYLLAGFPAGEAITRAKSSYLSELSNVPPVDLMTVLEFNLFGDPTIRLKTKINQSQIATGSSTHLELPNFKSGTFSTHITMEANFDKNDVLARVRRLVDSNLDIIRDRLNKLLPERFAVDPSTLRRIEKWESPLQTDYCFKYTPDQEDAQTTYVFTDTNGEIKCVFATI